MKQRAARQIQVRTVPIGREASIVTQSLITTCMRDVQASVAQIHLFTRYVELLQMKAGDQVAVQKQALPLKAEPACREKDDQGSI